MIDRVLIANRGEIALRILRACRELGLEVVAAHSRVDANQLHLGYADETVCISDVDYLDARAMISAAQSRNCDAIHPGYGMLAENAEFARKVESAGITWIGPGAELIARMGDKQAARTLASQHGLAVVPGPAHAVPDSSAAAAAVAAQVGYPVILKSVFGGGGRGMRVVSAEGDMERAFAEAQAESKAGFGRPELYVEKYLATPRHVEVQVLGDGKGQAIHLGTRECSIQRRHQKLIEEAPAPSLDGATLSALSEQCADMARDMEYGNAGTFEFLYQDEVFYFIEMNTRIQVEHPVTEMITGIDIVKAQLEIAITGELPVNQGAVNFTGHAIECRINAESMDASSGRIVPCPGLVYDYVVPGGPGIRVDSHLFNGYKVPHHYDSMVAKLIAWGRGRDEALRRIGRALREFQVRGVDTNIAVMSEVIGSTRFRNGDVDTAFLDASGSWLAA